jgi:hypothetical protein
MIHFSMLAEVSLSVANRSAEHIRVGRLTNMRKGYGVVGDRDGRGALFLEAEQDADEPLVRRLGSAVHGLQLLPDDILDDASHLVTVHDRLRDELPSICMTRDHGRS